MGGKQSMGSGTGPVSGAGPSTTPGTGASPATGDGKITVTLPDGTERSLAAGSTAGDLAASIGRRLARDALVARVNGSLVDLATPLSDGAEVEIVTGGMSEGRDVIRHSTAHVLAQAVLSLWPGARFAIGPVVEDGFYYDFELPGGERFTEAELDRISQRMREIVSEDQPFTREEHPAPEALELFSDQPFKREIIEGVAGMASPAVISTYRNSRSFADLCRGPHVPSTGRIPAFKLLRVAGAYWRGDEHRPQLQRIYGTAWESQAALDRHMEKLAEAERRDHRRLGLELDLFHFPPEVGSGLAVFHPKGALVRHLLESFSLREHLAGGYQLAWTPHVARAELFSTSGHLSWYAASMYPPMEMEGATYYLKPMNCPMHILVYKAQARSYRELPFRLFELGTVYRFERSGVLHGLARVRGLTQDDSHIFCAPGELETELASLVGFVIRILETFGLGEFEAELSTRPEKYVGSPEEWEQATAALSRALESSGIPYRVAEGEGAFYAPKIDIHLRDAIGRRWQVSTLQVDFQLPRLFDLEYVGPDNQRHRPFMIHRALFGSLERFFALLLEHYAGALPTWLAPVQVSVLPVAGNHLDYAEAVVSRAAGAGLRAELEPAGEPLGARIRRVKMAKVPYVLVVGDEDVAASTVGVNRRGASRPDRQVPLDDFLRSVLEEVASRS